MEQDGVLLEPDTIGLSQNSVHRMSSNHGKGASARQSLRYQEPAHPPYLHLDPENFNAFSHRSSFQPPQVTATSTHSNRRDPCSQIVRNPVAVAPIINDLNKMYVKKNFCFEALSSKRNMTPSRTQGTRPKLARKNENCLSQRVFDQKATPSSPQGVPAFAGAPSSPKPIPSPAAGLGLKATQGRARAAASDLSLVGSRKAVPRSPAVKICTYYTLA